MWFAVDTEIYPLKTDSEWKRALEKSLIDAAKFPLPMEVFKVRCWFLEIYLLFLRINPVKKLPASQYFPLFKKLPSWLVFILNV